MPSGRHDGAILVLVVVVFLVVSGLAVVVVAKGPGRRSDALAVARRLLTRQPLPPGSTPLHDKAPVWFPTSWIRPSGISNEINRQRYWSVPVSVPSLVSFLTFHPEPGVGDVGTGHSPHGLWRQVYEQEQFVRGAANGVVRLTFEVTSHGALGSWLKANAQVEWRPPKVPAELVPSNTRVVRMSYNPEPPQTRITRVTITNRRSVEALRNAFNSLPIFLPDLGAPDDVSPAVTTFAFASSMRAAPTLVARIDDNVVSFPSAGRNQPYLVRNEALTKAMFHALPKSDLNIFF